MCGGGYGQSWAILVNDGIAVLARCDESTKEIRGGFEVGLTEVIPVLRSNPGLFRNRASAMAYSKWFASRPG